MFFCSFFYFSFPFLPFYVPFSLFRLLFLSLFFFFPLSPSLFFFFPLPLFPLLFFFLFLTPLLVTFWRPLVATRGASARYAPQDTPLINTWRKMPNLHAGYSMQSRAIIEAELNSWNEW